MVIAIARPKLEGNVAVGDDRQLGFAEFGDPQGRAIFGLHGTPTGSTSSRACPTRSCINCPAKAILPAWAAPRKSCTP